MKYQVNMKDWETPVYRPLLWSTVFPYGSLTCWGWSPAQDISLPPSLSCVRGTLSRLLGQWSWLVIWKPQRQDESFRAAPHPGRGVSALERDSSSLKRNVSRPFCGHDKHRAPRKRLPLVSLPPGGQPVLGCDVPTAAQRGALPEVERSQVHREARPLLLFFWGLDSQARGGGVVSPHKSLGLASSELPLGTAVPAPCWGVRHVTAEERHGRWA